MAIFDFKDQFVQYGQYHHNPSNKAIHVVFVPLIMWTVQVWLCNTATLSEWPLASVAPLHMASLGSVAYILYYIVLEPFFGLSYTPVLLALLWSANRFSNLNAVFGMSPNAVAAILHVISWVMQISGHALAEKRAPAFVDNVFQAFVLAPLFVWAEVFFSLGFRPALNKELNIRIEREIAAWKKQAALRNGKNANTHSNSTSDSSTTQSYAAAVKQNQTSAQKRT